MPDPYSSTLGMLQNRTALQAQQQAEFQAQQQEMLRQQYEQSQAWQRAQAAQAAAQARQLQTEQFQTGLEKQRSADVLKNQWAGPTAYFGMTKNQRAEDQLKAGSDFMSAMAALPPNATRADAEKLLAASPDVLPAYVSAAMKMRGFDVVSPTEKELAKPVGLIPGKVFLNPDGTPATDPSMPVGTFFKGGGAVASAKDADTLAQANAAWKNLDVLESAGNVVLPAKPSFTAGFVDPAERWYSAKTGDPSYVAFQHAQAGLITYLRSLTGVGRVNQDELATVLDAFQSANTKAALASAVQQARKLINNERTGMVTAGHINPLRGAGEPAPELYWKGAKYTYTGHDTADAEHKPIYTDGNKQVVF
jgi:hypothetical protein